MTLSVTISGRTLRKEGCDWLVGPWRIHCGGLDMHEVDGRHDDAVRWIHEHGLTYDPTLVNP